MRFHKSLISRLEGFFYFSKLSKPSLFHSHCKCCPLYLYLLCSSHCLTSIFEVHVKKPIKLPSPIVCFSRCNHQIHLGTPHSLITGPSYRDCSKFCHKVLNNQNRISMISPYIIHTNPVKAFTLFLKLHGSNDFDPELCNSLIAALSSNEHHEFAKTVFDTMFSRGISMNNIGFGVLLGFSCRILELEKVLVYLDKMKQRMDGIHGSVIVFSFIDGLCRASKVENASWALGELRIRGFKPDFIAYRIVIEGFRSLGRVDEVERLSKQKRKLGVAPRMNEYKEFIFGLIVERRFREAKEVGEAIINGNFPIDDEALNALIGSVSEVDPDSAISFCRHMIAMDRFPSFHTVTNLGMNLCRHDKMDEMWDIFQLLMFKDYFADLESYNIVVSFLCKAGRVKEAYNVLKEMRKKEISPNIFSYNSLLDACCRKDLLRPAKKLWDEMFVNGCRGNLQTYSTLIQKFLESGEIEEAQQLFYHMLEKEVKPDELIYTSLIKGLCREAKLNDALDIFNKSMERDATIAGLVLNVLVHYLSKEGNFHMASVVMRGLLASGIDDINPHVILLTCMADSGKITVAIEHIEWVRDTSPSKLPVIANELIASLSSSLKLEPVMQLLQAMRERGLVSESNHWIHLCRESFSWS